MSLLELEEQLIGQQLGGIVLLSVAQEGEQLNTGQFREGRRHRDLPPALH